MDRRDFTRQMQRSSDEDLAEIVSFGDRDGYLPEAVEAARTELAARNLGPADLSTIAHSVDTRRTQEAELASQPLSWPARLGFLMFPIVGWPIGVVVALSLRTRGYRKKSSDAWKCMGLGVALWLGLVIYLVLVNQV